MLTQKMYVDENYESEGQHFLKFLKKFEDSNLPECHLKDCSEPAK